MTEVTCVLRLLVKDGKIVGRGHNRVLRDEDPTAHGEVSAIRNACANIGTYDLTGCDIYTTAESCPMCRAAIMWANISNVYFGCTVADTDGIGFRDGNFYENLASKGNMHETDRKECLGLFDEYKNSAHTLY